MVVGMRQYGPIQPLLAAKVVIDHPLHRMGALGDLVYTATRQSFGGKLFNSHGENIRPRGIRIPVRTCGRSAGPARDRDRCLRFVFHHVASLPKCGADAKPSLAKRCSTARRKGALIVLWGTAPALALLRLIKAAISIGCVTVDEILLRELARAVHGCTIWFVQ